MNYILSKKNNEKKHAIIPIFLASNDCYAPFVATTILSVVKNTKAFINFYILDGGITNEKKQKITGLKNKFKNFSIEFIDMEKYNLERFPEIRHYSTSAFSRYFIPELKPELEKAIYLDVDIIVTGDILELYNQNLEHYALGAILEDFYPANYTYLKKICPEYKGGSNYFNSGVLLINIPEFNKRGCLQKLLDCTFQYYKKMSCADQDIFNIIFQNNFKILDYKFNFMPDHKNYIIKTNKPNAIQSIKNHIVIHYTYIKPWKEKNVSKSDKFWEIAKQTPFYWDLKQNVLIKNFWERAKLTLRYLLSEGVF